MLFLFLFFDNCILSKFHLDVHHKAEEKVCQYLRFFNTTICNADSKTEI